MKRSILLASAFTLAVALPVVLHSSKALSAVPMQALATATKLPIPAGSNLPKGMKLASPSGNHILVVGTDGNLVVTRKDGGYVWGLDQVIDFTKVNPARVELRADGSLGAYNAQGAALWIAPARRDPSARLNVTDDGILQLTTPNEILWASKGAIGPLKLPLKAGTILQKGMRLASPSGNHLLVVGGDGNLMVTTRSAYVWGTDQVIPNFGKSTATVADRVEFRSDGSLLSYNDNGAVLWKAPVTRLDPKAALSVTDDGILQLVTATDILWASRGAVGSLVKEATRLPLTTGFVLKKGMKYSSPSGNFNLLLGNDSNLMVTDKNGGYLWGTDQVIPNFGQAGVDRVELRADGSLGSYNAQGAAVWTAPVTRRDPAAKLNLTDDGDLQLVAGNGDILWAHNGILLPRIKVFTRPVALKPCAETGWDNCVELADPKIKIISTRGTSASAVNAVANIYTEMMKCLKPAPGVPDPKRKFDGFKVYITNNESWEVQSQLPVVGTMWPDKTGPMSGRFLQGGASNNFLWISEQMIAKKGVKIRADDGAPDNNYRTFDQVVHEMAHSIDFQLVDDKVVNQFDGNGSAVESFAARVQQWFGVPAGPIPQRQEALLSAIFSSRAAFSIEGYRP